MSILRAPGWAARIDEILINEARFDDLQALLRKYAIKNYPVQQEQGTIKRTNMLERTSYYFGIKIYAGDYLNKEYNEKFANVEGKKLESNTLSEADIGKVILVDNDVNLSVDANIFKDIQKDIIYFKTPGNAKINLTINNIGEGKLHKREEGEAFPGYILMKYNTSNDFILFNDFEDIFMYMASIECGVRNDDGSKGRQGTPQSRISLENIYNMQHFRSLGKILIERALKFLKSNIEDSLEKTPTEYMQQISAAVQGREYRRNISPLINTEPTQVSSPEQMTQKQIEWSKVISKINGVTAKIEQEEETPIRKDKLLALQFVTTILQKYSRIISNDDDIANAIIEALDILQNNQTGNEFLDKLLENLFPLKRVNDAAADMYEEIVKGLTSYKESVKLTRQQTDRLLQEQYIKRKQFAYRMEELFRG
jgi:hypothetical protein